MNPSRYQLPQEVSGDRFRARRATLAAERTRFTLKSDASSDPFDEGFRQLPPSCAQIPPGFDFPASVISAMGLDRIRTWTIEGACLASNVVFPLSGERGYRALYKLMSGPTASATHWKDDADFGRQRMTGVNPMHLRRCTRFPTEALREAARKVLDRQQDGSRAKLTLDEAMNKGRLFSVEYPSLWDPRVQKHVARGASLAAPTCIYWSNEVGDLMPLAIQLKPADVAERNPVFTPLDPYADWMMARSHIQAADSHVHEAGYHLLETHLVSGAVALCMYRELHPDHPVRQLLDPHYEYNLAINELALGGLLAKGGTIDNALTAGVEGAMNAARMYYSKWSFAERNLRTDLADRGVDDQAALPQYFYRDDACEVHDAIARFVASILALWYRNDEDVVKDTELQAFVAAGASRDGADIPGFPSQLTTREQLFSLVTELIFRAGPQHAAVNNGQYDAYGFIPCTPGIVMAELPTEGSGEKGVYTEEFFWKAMPSISRSLAQMGMVWVLSRPTKRSLLHAGDAPAFSSRLCFEADEIIASFRQRLRNISDSINRRNERLPQPYRYLDPMNVSRSTDI